MRVLLSLMWVLALAACDENIAGPSVPIARELVLAPGQTAVISEAGISITFTGVLGDSRCPADAMCIRAGEGIIRIDVQPPSGGRSQYELRTDDGKPATHGAFTITLTNLSPYPMHSRPTQPGDYRATLMVRRQ